MADISAVAHSPYVHNYVHMNTAITYTVAAIAAGYGIHAGLTRKMFGARALVELSGICCWGGRSKVCMTRRCISFLRGFAKMHRHLHLRGAPTRMHIRPNLWKVAPSFVVVCFGVYQDRSGRMHLHSRDSSVGRASD